MTLDCPHCGDSVNEVSRTGDKRYACGDCNMVISYEEIQPHLDELNVIDKRQQSATTKSDEEPNNEDIKDGNPTDNSPSHTLNERERIYQRGTNGLREIKKTRLENWLGTSEGVGNQTEQRILMVFERNESVHRNPHVLYNLLDDELNASASYLNTMVEDIFSPEEEHGDLLQSQGYTPWYSRGAGQGSRQIGRNVGGPMNATGSTGFSPNQSFGSQGQQQPPSQQQGSQEPEPQNGGGGAGEEVMTRDDAEVMMRQAMAQANSEDERNALLSGLSNATDEALQEMATNVGGLAGTIQKVVDEALVGYARENPQWVIENMDILQKVIGATEDMPGGDDSSSRTEPEQHQKVDSAIENITSGESSSPQPTVAQSAQPAAEPEPTEPNPDLDEEYLEKSDFDPMAADPDSSDPDDDTEPDTKPMPDGEAAKKSEETKQQFESESNETEDEDNSFDEIFGDLQ